MIKFNIAKKIKNGYIYVLKFNLENYIYAYKIKKPIEYYKLHFVMNNVYYFL